MSVTWQDWDDVCFAPRYRGKTLTQWLEQAAALVGPGSLKAALGNFPDVNTYYAHRDNDRQFDQ